MNIVIIPNLTRKNAMEITENVSRTLDSLGITYRYFFDSDTIIDSLSDKTISENEISAFADIIITIGGDGTIIRAAATALMSDIPILGINAGNLAYLVCLEENELSLLENLKTNNYTTENRFVLKVQVFDENNNHLMTDLCINEAVFARGAEIKLAELDLYCDDRFINRYNADGLIISTPTGSTAYNLSAGGPIVDPRIESIILSPICPHSLAERTVIFSSDSCFRIKNPGNTTSVMLSCDGREGIAFRNGYSALIEKADKKVKLLRLKDDTFMEILHKKMKTNKG